MAERIFVDTNILIYAYDRKAGSKRTRARDVLAPLFRERRAVVSTQILQEFFAVSTRKLKIPGARARHYVEALTRLDVVVIRSDTILGAIDLHRLHSLSFWDALVIKSAGLAGCSRVLSEDLNSGQLIDGIEIENPL